MPAEIARLEGVITRQAEELKETNSRLTNTSAYLQKIGYYYEHLARKEHDSIPPGPNCEALQTLINYLVGLKNHLSPVTNFPQLE